MKVGQKYRCKACGEIFPIEEVLTPPEDGKVAEPKPCPKCGEKDWGSAR